MADFGTRNEESIDTRLAAEDVLERTYLAVQQLCIGKGDVRDRLKSAVFTLLVLQEKDFPQELRNDFNWIIFESTKHPSEIPGYRSDLEQTMIKIRNSSGQKIAERILLIYSRIQEIRGFPLLQRRDPLQ